MKTSLTSWVTLLGLLVGIVSLVSCSDDTASRRSARSAEREFTPDEQELVEEVIAASPDVTVRAMPNQMTQTERAEHAESSGSAPKGVTMVSLGRNAVVNDDLLETMRALNSERPIGVIQLRSKNLRDDDLRKLSEMDQVFHLSISGEKISDAGLEHVSRLPEIRELRLDGCKITDAGIARLSKLTELRSLWIGGSDVTGTGFARLTNLSNLSTIMAGGSKIDDEGLASLATVKSIKILQLSHNKITDKGLGHLKKLPKLQTVNIEYNRKLTKDGVAALRRAMPKLQIIAGPWEKKK